MPPPGAPRARTAMIWAAASPSRVRITDALAASLRGVRDANVRLGETVRFRRNIMDRTTKILLAAIATGLWANAAATVMPNVIRSAHAQNRFYARETANDWQKAVTLLANGDCINTKLC
jgi:hypothetical protein